MTPSLSRAAPLRSEPASDYYENIYDIDFYARGTYRSSVGDLSLRVAEPGVPLWDTARRRERILRPSEREALRRSFGARLPCPTSAVEALASLLRLEADYRAGNDEMIDRGVVSLSASDEPAIRGRAAQIAAAVGARRQLTEDLPLYLSAAAPTPKELQLAELLEGLRIDHGARVDAEGWGAKDAMVEAPVRRDFIRRGVSLADRKGLLEFYQQTLSYAFELTAANHQVETLSNYSSALEAVGPGQGRRFLDYGAGIGTLSILAAKAGYQVDMVDLPSATFDHGCRRLGMRPALLSQVQPATADGDCAVPDGWWDVIACTEVLEHVFTPFELLRELLVRLAPGGFLLVSESFDYVDEFCTHLPQHRGLGGTAFVERVRALSLAQILVRSDCHVQVWQKG